MEPEIWYSLAPARYSRYAISNYGRIYSYITQKLLVQNSNGCGYMVIDLQSDLGFAQSECVHRLMGKYLIPGWSPELTIDHINQNRKDNRLSNLRWATRSEQTLNSTPREKQGRKIHQYDSNKNYIRSWDRVRDAEEDGFERRSIHKVIDQDHMYKDCYWRYDDVDLLGEIWVSTRQAFPEFEPIQVSTHGRVKRAGGEISEGFKSGSYLSTKLKKIDTLEYKERKIHRLVLACFTVRNDSLFVVHKDGDRTNNRLDNLEYGTASDSINTAIKTGHAPRLGKSARKPVRQLSLTGEFIARFESMVEAEKVTKVRSENISNNICGKQNTAGGFRWELEV